MYNVEININNKELLMIDLSVFPGLYPYKQIAYHINLCFPPLLNAAEYAFLNMLSAQVPEDWGKEKP